MLKLKWPGWKKKTGETAADAPRDATTDVKEATTDVKEATTPNDLTGAQDEARATESLEVIKTAVVWLVVVNILAVLSPLLWLPLKWTLAVGFLLTASSVVIGVVAYLRARAMQRHFPE